MREIKFRAWHKKSKRMAYNVQNEYDTVNGVRFEGTDFEPGESCFASYLCNEEYSVMQFTGLKDKNGKEIYEGDILTHKENYFIKYGPHGLWIMSMVHPKANWELGEGPIKFLYHCYSESEVIGNIHENPELLTPEDSNEAK